MAIHSSILDWRIPWAEELGGLQPRGHKDTDTIEVTNHAGIHGNVHSPTPNLKEYLLNEKSCP